MKNLTMKVVKSVFVTGGLSLRAADGTASIKGDLVRTGFMAGDDVVLIGAADFLELQAAAAKSKKK